MMGVVQGFQVAKRGAQYALESFTDQPANLTLAVLDQDLEKVKRLIALGEDVNDQNYHQGKTPLHLAAEYDLVDIAKVSPSIVRMPY